MFVPRRFIFTFTVAIVLACITAGIVRAVNEAPAAPTNGEVVLNLKAKIDGTDAAPIDAEVAFPTVKFQSTYGLHEYRTEKLKEISIDKADANGIHVGIQLDDDTRLHGTLLMAKFPIRVGGEMRELVPVEGMKIKFHKPGDFGILAAIIGLITLAVMEIILGIDNIVMLAIISGKLPQEQQPKARRIGLAAALVTRLGLLFTLTWLLGLTKPLFTLPEMPLFRDPEARAISLRDLALLIGGMFLIRKSVKELHEDVEGEEKSDSAKSKKPPSFLGVILQIAFIDIIFSLDSVITAVGMVEHLWVMVVAMIIAVGVMMVFAESISRFIAKHPTVKVLALSFLILIGVLLVAEGFGQHIDKGYIYFAMAFSMLIELINMRLRKARHKEK
jgi:predicted tellurium resistance membrane protein TerC